MTASVIQAVKNRKRKLIGFRQEGSTENFHLKWDDANSSENHGELGGARDATLQI